jgi:uncharacterized protein (TIGR02452 family)
MGKNSKSRSNRRELAKKTLEEVEQGYYFNAEGIRQSIRIAQEAAEAGTELWPPSDLEELQAIDFPKVESTQIHVSADTSLDAVRRLAALFPNKRIACLNFASAKNAGGGFLNGSQAQEESIARATGLYPCQLLAEDYYSYHRKLKTCLYSDHMIYSPQVPVIKHENGEPMDRPILCSFVTSPAVNAGVVRRQEKSNTDLIIPVMRTRIDKLLSLFAEKGEEVLVLGAWGCGVFQNEPEDIAKLFHEALETRFKDVFDYVEFAVYSSNPRFIKPFEAYFGQLNV